MWEQKTKIQQTLSRFLSSLIILLRNQWIISISNWGYSMWTPLFVLDSWWSTKRTRNICWPQRSPRYPRKQLKIPMSHKFRMKTKPKSLRINMFLTKSSTLSWSQDSSSGATTLALEVWTSIHPRSKRWSLSLLTVSCRPKSTISVSPMTGILILDLAPKP
jgi:hypothetical protein